MTTEISKYQAMWLVVLFDLPVNNQSARRRYSQFRTMLLREGFGKLQYSVYARYCVGEEIAKKYRKMIADDVPAEGQVRILTFTDVQFGKMAVFEGKTRVKPENAPQQYLLS